MSHEVRKFRKAHNKSVWNDPDAKPGATTFEWYKTPKVGTPFADRAVAQAHDTQGRVGGPMVQHTSNRFAARLRRQENAATGRLRWAKVA